MPGLSELIVAGRQLRRVGHKGADLIVPGNTRASFDAAVEVGVDMIEFDVLRDREDERLVLAHDPRETAERTRLQSDDREAADQGLLTLDEGLAHLASDPFAGIELNVDLKLPGYELEVVAALRGRGLLERALISSQYRESLALIRASEPGVRLGWSVPKLRQDPFRNRLMWIPASALVLAGRELMPGQAARAIRAGECDALMAHWRLVTPRLVRSIARAGGELYVWTVDELPRMRALDAIGVTGVISNDPRLFTGLSGG